jgi:hypothetical protein
MIAACLVGFVALGIVGWRRRAIRVTLLYFVICALVTRI